MISAMVLAAGRSRRMGTQKLLLPFRGQALIAGIVDELLRSEIDSLFVVVGQDGPAIRDALAGRRVQWVVNPRADDEMLYSVRCGLAAMPRASSAALVALGDQPGIGAEIVSELVRAFHASGCGIIVPTYNGRRGHPLLFSMQYRTEVLTHHDGCGLRGLLAAHPRDVFELQVGSAGVLEDIDLPEDYRGALERLARQADP